MTIIRHCWRGLLLVIGLSFFSAAGAAGPVRIMAGPERGVQWQMARELANAIGSRGNPRIQVIATAGPSDTLLRLQDERGVGLGLLPADTAASYQAAATRGFGEAASLLGPLRVIASLQPASFHFIVRADAGFTSFDAIRGARINLGPVGGNTALSVMNLYRSVFGEPIADDRVSFLDHETALARLVTDQTIDVVAIVAEQPARIVADMKREARRYVRLLPAPVASLAGLNHSRFYTSDRLLAGNYPSLLDGDVETAAVRTVLVAQERQRSENEAVLVSFANAMCSQLTRLKREGHPAWQTVDFAPPASGAGWHYASPSVLDEIARCTTTMPQDLLPSSCSAGDRALRLCE